MEEASIETRIFFAFFLGPPLLPPPSLPAQPSPFIIYSFYCKYTRETEKSAREWTEESRNVHILIKMLRSNDESLSVALIHGGFVMAIKSHF
jgi:hypothetical protein